MIKIAFVIDTIESPTAGTEKQLLLLIKHLDRTKFKPYLCILRQPKWLRENFTDCEIIEVGVLSFRHLRTYLNILNFARFLRTERIDVVQTHFVDANKVGIAAGKLAGVKAIVSTRRNQGYWHNDLEVKMLKAMNKAVTCFVANSEDTRRWAERTEGIRTANIQVIHNGVEVHNYWKGSANDRATFRKTLAFPPDAIVVGLVANLRPVKAIEVFIRAAGIIHERCSNTRFIVVGDGPEKERLLEFRDLLGLGPYIRFTGKRLDIPEILSCIDVGVLSSASESFSNAIVEYLAAGIPVVCTDVGGAKEAVDDGYNGFVVKPGDYTSMAGKVTSIIFSGHLAAFGNNSRRKAESLFGLPAIMERYTGFYEEVVTRSPPWYVPRGEES